MEISLFLDSSYCNKIHEVLYPTLGEQTPHFIQTLQAIASIDKILETPHLEHCLSQIKALDPNMSFSIDFFDPIHDYHSLIEKEKTALKHLLKKKQTMMSVKEAIRHFHEVKEKNCKKLIDLYEVQLERDRLDKIMRLS